MNANNYKEQLDVVNTRTICIYLIIVTSVLYLILYGSQKAYIIDKLFGTHLQNKFPDTSNYSKIIVIIFLIVNSVFLYITYILLEEQKRTGTTTSFDAYHVAVYVNILQFVATILAAYNVFVNQAEITNITR